MCEAATDAEACEFDASDAVFDATQGCAACVWDDWVPTTLDENGACVFGEVSASCRMVVLGTEGCQEAVGVCGSEPTRMPTWRPGAGGGLELHVGPALECFFNHPPDGGLCLVDENGNVQGESPPECACLCDPAFPDAP